MKTAKKILGLALAMALAVMSLAACGGGGSADATSIMADCTYQGRSSDFDEVESGNGSG